MELDLTKPKLGPAALQFLESKHQMLIDGKWVDAKSGKKFDTYDPATGEVIGQVPEGGKADVDLAVAAARRAFDTGPWSKMTGGERTKILWRVAELIEKYKDELAELESLNNGKPITQVKSFDISTAVEILRYTAGWATKLTGDTLSLSQRGDFHAFTMREPIGVAGVIIPYNGPLVSAVWKSTTPLAAGCTVVLKVAAQTPLTALRLGQIFLEAGFPDGVINIVTGLVEAGEAMASHPDIDKVSFTGSSEIGKLVLEAASKNFKKVALGLGGKSPIIVFPDADLDIVIPGVARAIFTNSGQVCGAGTRLYAHKSVYDKVVEGVANIAKKHKLGHGLNPASTMGPVISKAALDRICGHIEKGKKEGATVLTGGGRVGDVGYFMAPTILTDTTLKMSVVQEEIFGPVLCAMQFVEEDLDKIAAEANGTNFGLAGSIWTRNISVALKMAKKIKAGQLGINMHTVPDPAVPRGGLKTSGWGRERGKEGIEGYTDVKSIAITL